jgi:hypothetical protein
MTSRVVPVEPPLDDVLAATAATGLGVAVGLEVGQGATALGSEHGVSAGKVGSGVGVGAGLGGGVGVVAGVDVVVEDAATGGWNNGTIGVVVAAGEGSTVNGADAALRGIGV